MNTKNLLFASSLLALPACHDAISASSPAAPPPVPVRVLTVQRATLPRTLHAVGRLAHKRSLQLAFKNGGTVRALFVAEGAQVKRGQKLAAIDTTEIDAQVMEVRANVAKADRDLARAGTLIAHRAVTEVENENARTAAALAHAQLDAALYNQAAAVLLAPEDGHVDKRFVEVGEQVPPGRSIFAMSGSAAGVVVHVGVVDRDWPDVRLGDTASVQIDAWPGRVLAATVSEIATAPSSTSGTYDIELRFAPTDLPLASGMTAKVELRRPPSEALPVVPLTALVDAEGNDAQLYTIVTAAGGESVARIKVTLAAVVGDQATVSRGLSGGERIVSEGASFVEVGRLVRSVVSDPALEVADAHR